MVPEVPIARGLELAIKSLGLPRDQIFEFFGI